MGDMGNGQWWARFTSQCSPCVEVRGDMNPTRQAMWRAGPACANAAYVAEWSILKEQKAGPAGSRCPNLSVCLNECSILWIRFHNVPFWSIFWPQVQLPQTSHFAGRLLAALAAFRSAACSMKAIGDMLERQSTLSLLRSQKAGEELCRFVWQVGYGPVWKWRISPIQPCNEENDDQPLDFGGLFSDRPMYRTRMPY